MKNPDYFSLRFTDGHIEFLDQTKLPGQLVYVRTNSVERVAEAIERLEIRGAPLIGIAAAYALALSQSSSSSAHSFESAYKKLLSTRPTAVNLKWGLDEIAAVYRVAEKNSGLYEKLIARARAIHREDEEKCERIAANGLRVFVKPSIVLTHCNTGKLAVGGGGTAFYVIQQAFREGLVKHVFADETRPLLQGLRLTAFELYNAGIPFSVITDSMAATVLRDNKVDLVITGADRIARNGDTANKIGTYMLAVLCKHHGIPFYIAAPTTTIDAAIADGSQIPIEERNSVEILSALGEPAAIPYPVFNPAFDVTPAGLITGIITDNGLFEYPFSFV